MKSRFGHISLLLLGAALTVSAVSVGCAEHRYSRVNDPYYNDYHRWNGNEDANYRRWEAEQRYEHHEYRERQKEQQKAYWDWRHKQEHHDHDRDHDHDKH
jgi:hypothetical protein